MNVSPILLCGSGSRGPSSSVLTSIRLAAALHVPAMRALSTGVLPLKGCRPFQFRQAPDGYGRVGEGDRHEQDAERSTCFAVGVAATVRGRFELAGCARLACRCRALHPLPFCSGAAHDEGSSPDTLWWSLVHRVRTITLPRYQHYGGRNTSGSAPGHLYPAVAIFHHHHRPITGRSCHPQTPLG